MTLPDVRLNESRKTNSNMREERQTMVCSRSDYKSDLKAEVSNPQR